MSNARDTYIASVKSAEANAAVAGFAGNLAAAPNVDNNTNQYVSLTALRADYAQALITRAQFVSYANQTAMAAQVAIQTAKDVLRATGDPGN
jgi:hypothetical protein